MIERKLLYVKFLDAETVEENGRHLFALLNAFSRAGYRIQICESVIQMLGEAFGADPDRYPPPARLALKIANVTIVRSPPGDHGGIYAFDKEDSALSKLPWEKKIQIKFDLFSRYRFSHPMVMPYGVHPIHATTDLDERVAALRSTPRRLRVLFAGDSKGYRREWIRYPETKLSRLNVLDTIRSRMSDGSTFITRRTELDELLRGPSTNKCVVVDNQTTIPWDQWLATISIADFFLCPPGIVMPMCHNAVEAMAVGTIPIINYAEWFSPRLVHLENCIVFRDARDLVEKLKLVQEMDSDQVAAMRRKAIAYFETHLNPVDFVRRVERVDQSRVPILIYSEKNVAENFKRLNGNSILIRGENAAGKWAWVKSILPKSLRVGTPIGE